MRLSRHARLVIFMSILLVVSLYGLLGFSQEMWGDIPARKATSLKWRSSMALAYSSTILFVITLSIGSWRVITQQHNPTHNPLRRAFGVAAAILGLLHLLVGITVHTAHWDLSSQFFRATEHAIFPYVPRIDYFGRANFSGLFQGVLLVLLIGLSTNFALKKFGVSRWKMLQRLAYIAFASIIFHAYYYQLIEERSLILRLFFFAVVSIAILMQIAGVVVRVRSSQQKIEKPVSSIN